MIIIKVLQIILGLIFIIYGYLIYFLDKRSFIINYSDDKYSDKGVKNYGLITLVGGIILSIFGGLSFILNDTFTIIQLFIILLGLGLVLFTNPKK